MDDRGLIENKNLCWAEMSVFPGGGFFPLFLWKQTIVNERERELIEIHRSRMVQ